MERVNIIGASDGIENGMSDIPIGTYAAVVTLSTGERHIGMFPNYVGYCRHTPSTPSRPLSLQPQRKSTF